MIYQMTFAQRRAFLDALWTGQLLPLLEGKGKEYAQGAANSNFRTAAEFLGCDKYAVWAVYFYKHCSSIFQWVRTKQTFTEAIQGRVNDAIVYLLILSSMLHEDAL